MENSLKARDNGKGIFFQGRPLGVGPSDGEARLQRYQKRAWGQNGALQLQGSGNTREKPREQNELAPKTKVHTKHCKSTIRQLKKQINGKRWHSNNDVHSLQSESQSSRSYLTGVTTKINSSASPAFPFDSKLTSNWLNVRPPQSQAQCLKIVTE